MKPPKMTFSRTLRAEALRLRRSFLVPLHLVCALVAGAACGAYFAIAPWDEAMGADAFAQLLGAAMPLMVGIVCGLDVDAEESATRLSALLAVPSRRAAFAGRLFALWFMGAVALILSLAVFSAALILASRSPFGIGVWAGAAAGASFGIIPLYLALYAVALRWGRNVSIVAGALGLMLALFSVGGLAHGLMTGELTASAAGMLAWLPTSWATLLGSLPIELAIAAGSAGSPDLAAHVVSALGPALGMCSAGTALLLGVLVAWVPRFEPTLRGE